MPISQFTLASCDGKAGENPCNCSDCYETALLAVCVWTAHSKKRMVYIFEVGLALSGRSNLVSNFVFAYRILRRVTMSAAITNATNDPGLEPPSEGSTYTADYLLTLPLNEMWNCILEQKLEELKIKDKDRILDKLEYGKAKGHLEDMLKKYEARRSYKLLKFIKPLVEGLSTFSPGINNLTKSPPAPSSDLGICTGCPRGEFYIHRPIMGGISVDSLKGAKSFYDILKAISALIEILEYNLQRCQDYRKLFPDDQRLGYVFLNLHGLCMEACIRTEIHFQKPPWGIVTPHPVK